MKKVSTAQLNESADGILSWSNSNSLMVKLLDGDAMVWLSDDDDDARPRRQKIKVDQKEDRLYVAWYNRKIYLDTFMRVKNCK